jgi:hypothetical protein
MTAPTPDQQNLAAALECLRLMLESQQAAIAHESVLTPLQVWLALWSLK